MKSRLIEFYFEFFDRQIGSSIVVVGIIGAMIFLVGLLLGANAGYSKANLFEYSNVYTINSYNNIIYIDGKKYRFVLQKLE